METLNKSKQQKNTDSYLEMYILKSNNKDKRSQENKIWNGISKSNSLIISPTKTRQNGETLVSDFKHSSPVKKYSLLNPTITNMEDTMKEIEKKLKYIFISYNQYGDKRNFNNLKFIQFFKLCRDSNIITDTLNKEQLYLIYTQTLYNDKKVQSCDFEGFLNLLKVLSVKVYTSKYPKLPLSEYLKVLLEINVLPLYSSIVSSQSQNELNNSTNSKSIKSFIVNNSLYNKSTINSQHFVLMHIIPLEEILSLLRTEETINLIQYSATCLFEIYEAYFTEEFGFKNNSTLELNNKSKTSFIQFLADFEICPLLISKNSSYSIFNSSLIEPSEEYKDTFNKIVMVIPSFKKKIDSMTYSSPFGESFTFYSFFLALLKIAHFSFIKLIKSKLRAEVSDIDNINYSFDIKLCFLFEKMQRSNGLAKFRLRCPEITSNTKNTNIIPNDSLLVCDSIIKELFEQKQYNDNKTINYKSKRISCLSKQLDFNYYNYINDKFGHDLQMIFKYYVSFGDTHSNSKMKLSKYYKFLRDANLIEDNSLLFKNTLMILTKSTIENDKDKLGNTFKLIEQGYWINKDDVDVIFYKVIKESGRLSNKESKKSKRFSSVIKTKFSTIERDNNFNKNQQRSSSLTGCIDLNFEQFLCSIEVICVLLFPNHNIIKAIDIILENNILPLLFNVLKKQSKCYPNYIQEKEINKEFSNAVNLLVKATQSIYPFYSGSNGKFSFMQFLLFCKDFEVFPYLLSKYKIKSFFSNLLNKEIFNDDDDLLFHSDFCELIGIASYDVMIDKLKSNSALERLLLFIDHLVQSRGMEKLVLKTNKMSEIKQSESSLLFKSFLDYFPSIKLEKKSISSFKVLKNNDFFELIGDSLNR